MADFVRSDSVQGATRPSTLLKRNGSMSRRENTARADHDQKISFK